MPGACPAPQGRSTQGPKPPGRSLMNDRGNAASRGMTAHDRIRLTGSSCRIPNLRPAKPRCRSQHDSPGRAILAPGTDQFAVLHPVPFTLPFAFPSCHPVSRSGSASRFHSELRQARSPSAGSQGASNRASHKSNPETKGTPMPAPPMSRRILMRSGALAASAAQTAYAAAAFLLRMKRRASRTRRGTIRGRSRRSS